MDELAVIVFLSCVGASVQQFFHPFVGPQAGHTGFHPCLPIQSRCSLSCAGGYVKGPNGCDFCSCRTVTPSLVTTTILPINYTDPDAVNTNPLNHVTQPTSPRAYAGTGTIANPCIPSQRVCALQCAGGYSKGPSGCEFCMCAPSLNFGHTTWGSVLVDPLSTVKPQTASTVKPPTAKPLPVSTVSSAQSVATQTTLQSTDPCIIAKSNCVVACGTGGYLTDPTDCTVCVCKSTLFG